MKPHQKRSRKPSVHEPRLPFLPRDPGIRSQLRVSAVYWACIVGIGLWVALRALGVDPQGPPLYLMPFLSVLAAAVANLSVRSWVALSHNIRQNTRRYNHLGWLFVSLDLTLVALGLRATGGMNSPLWLVLFVVVVAETIMASRAEANVIRVCAAAALLGGTIPVPLTQSEVVPFLLEFGTRVGFLIAVSIVTSRLRRNAADKEMENAALRAELGLAVERGSLARDIHDGIGNSLAAAVLRLEFAARSLEKKQQNAASPFAEGSVELVEMLKEEANALRDAMTTVRDWTFFTKPWTATAATGEGEEAAAVLTAEVERLSRRTGLPIIVSGAEIMAQLSPVLRLTTLRIVQEALTNAAKYAKGATQAEVALRREGIEYVLTITDDGPGFDLSAAGAGLGIVSMKERAEGAGGVFSVITSPGHGAALTARFRIA